MNDDERRQRGSSFGSAAAAYAEHRPDYPEEAVRWCLAPAGSDVTRLKVLDLGAGTGKLTAQLVAMGGDVTAVEPDPAMLSELLRQLPSVRAEAGSAESIPLPDGSVHAVLCGQALHWFNLEAALPEIARVLAPGGVLGALWNSDDDRVEWVAGLQAAAEGAASPSLSRRRVEAADVSLGTWAARGLFTPVVRAEFANAQVRTADSLLATVATHSKFLTMPEARRQRLLAQVRAYLYTRPETAQGEFMLPMVTSALRGIRKAKG